MKVCNLINYLVNSVRDGDIEINDEVLLCCKSNDDEGYNKYSKIICTVGYGDGKCSILGTEPKIWSELFPDSPRRKTR